MNISLIGSALQTIVDKVDQGSFIYELLLAYNLPKASIARLKSGNLNLSKQAGELIWKKKLLFCEITDQAYAKADLLDQSADETKDPHHLIDQLKSSDAARIHFSRFIVVTDYKTFLAFDTKTKDSLDIELKDLAKHADFFLPWAGMEKAQVTTENAADVKAAVNMAKLYDLITAANPASTAAQSHTLNVFLSRLLFCFFAEDTGIFTERQFTNAVSSHTQADGTDLAEYLDAVFKVMNTAHKDRASGLPSYLNAFEYVNGGLFKENSPAPKFNRKSRELLIELGSLDWAQINPDIFGSMIQAVVLPSQRGDLGMHYTSVPNIMKVIGPLFLDELEAEFEAAQFEPRKLDALRVRISRIKIFDPACGSGNFLITAYKKLCELEVNILQQRLDLQKMSRTDLTNPTGTDGFALPQGELIPKAQRTLAQSFQLDMFSSIKLSQFYGIEIDDFAHEIATLSLWLAQHQMNVQFKKLFGESNSTLPLAPSGNIVHGNACREDWELVCPKQTGDEIYILGNPPYVGSRIQDVKQKADMELIFGDAYKSIDYIAAWFYKASNFIKNSNSTCAFVSTNSICQGEQVSLIWQRVLDAQLEIGFAHKNFKWMNSARNNAAVIVVIVGIRNKKNAPKFLFHNQLKTNATKINPYLVESDDVYLKSRSNQISNLPEMNFGNMPADDGKLLFTDSEKIEFIAKGHGSEKLFKKLISAHEFLNGQNRWCLWLEDFSLSQIAVMPHVYKIVSDLKVIRQNSSRPQLSKIPHLFAQITQPANQNFICIPCHSSENREYIPMGIFNSNNKAHNSCLIIPTNDVYVFSLLTSKIHMAWVKAVCGRIKTDFRYSKDIVYNNFPFPKITERQKSELEQFAFRILEAREQHTEKTLAQMYENGNIPDDLRAAHEQNDLAVERCYRSKPFISDEERLAYLFTQYEQMIAVENAQMDLLAVDKPAAKSKTRVKKAKITN
jgi:hypothetical protein